MGIEETKMLSKILMEIKNIKVIVQDIEVIVREDSDAIDSLLKEDKKKEISVIESDSNDTQNIMA